jgi:hypothetical protein
MSKLDVVDERDRLQLALRRVVFKFQPRTNAPTSDGYHWLHAAWYSASTWNNAPLSVGYHRLHAVWYFSFGLEQTHLLWTDTTGFTPCGISVLA